MNSSQYNKANRITIKRALSNQVLNEVNQKFVEQVAFLKPNAAIDYRIVYMIPSTSAVTNQAIQQPWQGNAATAQIAF